MIDAAQIRAARALLDWNRDQLAAASGVSVPALAKIEGEKSSPHAETLVKVQGALEQAGIVFGDSSGVKKKTEIVTIFEGKEGLRAFFDDVYVTSNQGNKQILISGGNQQDFYDAVGLEFVRFHGERMSQIKNLEIRALKPLSRVGEGGQGYIQFRAIPDQMFFTVPFYVYAQKLAIIVWNPLKVVVLGDSRIADAYAQQFHVFWKLGRTLDSVTHEEVAL